MFLKLKKFFIACPENKFKPPWICESYIFWFLFILSFLHVIPILFYIYFPNDLMFADITKAALVAMTNAERRTLGLEGLASDPILEKAAQAKAQDMFEKGYFSHESPQGVAPWFWFKKAGYDYSYAGENLAIGFLDSEEVYNGWANSYTHHQNILNPNYSEIGLAVAKGKFNGQETTIVVQLFGTRKNGNKTPAVLTQPPIQQKSGEAGPIPQNKKGGEEPIAATTEENPKIRLSEPQVAGQKTAIFDRESFIGNADFSVAQASFRQKIFQFLAFNYNDLLKMVTLYSLITICVIMVLNVQIIFETSNRNYVFKAIFCLLLLAVFTFLNKATLIELIPHSFSIQ